MNIKQAITAGAMLWGIIFIEWSIIVFAPVLKDLSANGQFLVHFLVLIPIVIFGAQYYYRKADKTNGFVVGLAMLATGIVLDAIITVPLFVGQDGTTHAQFFLNPLMLAGFAEFLIIMGLYWKKKVA